MIDQSGMVNSRNPNVVFIMANDHRYEAIHANGNCDVITPVLDKLAAQGTSFCQTHIFGGLTGAVCAPSRACVHTGQSIFRSMIGCDIKIWKHSVDIRPDVMLMPQSFLEAGYYTHAIGKWHNDKASFIRSFAGGEKLFFYGMSDHDRMLVQDYDPMGVYAQEQEYVGEGFSTELFTDAAVSFIERYESDQPFYLYVAYTAPHDPRTAPEPYASMYDPQRIQLPPNFMDAHPFDNGDLDIRDERLAQHPRDEAEIRQHIADYYAMITHMDAQIGRVIAALKENGLYENTLIVYTADHGLAVGQHGLMGKQNLYDHSTRIPFILRGPGVPYGQRVEALTSNIDIFPTVADLCGIELPFATDGINMASHMQEVIEKEGTQLCKLSRAQAQNNVQTRSVVCTAYRDLQRMALDGSWKLIRYYRSPITNKGTDSLQLFNLEEDPWELHDVSKEAANEAHLKRLSKELYYWMQKNGDFMKDALIL